MGRILMNVQDVASKTTSSGDKLEAIFNKQRSLMEKYEEIEQKNGLLQTKAIPVDLHDRFGQARLKDFSWRFTEELAEALEAYEIHPELIDHVHEEIVDGLHFLTEMTILSGVTPANILEAICPANFNDKLDVLFMKAIIDTSSHKIPDGIVGIKIAMADTIGSLGCVCNTLKNKPWKNTHMLTDENLYRKHLFNTWKNFIKLCLAYGITAQRLDDLYFRKSEVNKFRIRSNY
jgi:dimeric dUTPase (all-alpha-NTP-PPase superfamily)